MTVAKTTIRVRYAEVDRLGAVNSARYFEWFELGRSDLLRELGIPYDELERSGIALPVVEAGCRYLAKLGYDEVVRLETTARVESPARVRFDIKVWRVDGGEETLAAEGFTINAAVGADGKPTRLPAEVVAAVDKE